MSNPFDKPLNLKDLQDFLSGEWKLYARANNTDLFIAVGSDQAKVLDTTIAKTVGEPIQLYLGSDFSQAIHTFNHHAGLL